MTEKIQMTEEQAREYEKERKKWTCETCGKTPCKAGEEDCDYQFLKRNGYIRKSELQQKVEEAEAMYKLFNSHEWNYSVIQLIEKQNEAVQLLKQSHPEFKGE